MAEANVVIQTTAKKYLKGAIDGTMRNRLALMEMQKRGKILFNQDGYDLTYDIEFDQPPITPTSDGATMSFSRHDLFRQATHDYRGYKGTDLVTDKEKEMNKGNAALVRMWDGKIKRLVKAMKDAFNAEFFIDGYASGNEERVCGLDSMFGTDGNTVAADLVGNPSDTYHNRSTALASEGGSWSTDLGSGNYPNATVATDWPEGQGSAKYDYYSPIHLNRTSSSWLSGTTDWEDVAPRVIRKMKDWCTHRGGAEGVPNLLMLATGLMTGFKNSNDPALRIMVPHKASQDLGFEDVLNFDGLAIKSEYDVVSGSGYLINYDQMELRCLTGDLFVTNGPDFDPRTHDDLFAVKNWSNYRHYPKMFGKLSSLA